MNQQLIIGMPASGKSTFIGALRHLLVAKEVSAELELTVLSDSERHLNNLEAAWLDCKEVERTKPASEGWVEFHVRNNATGAQAVLSVPDLRGEVFQQPLCSGRCPGELYRALGDAEGILLFTNADRPEDAGLISDLNELLDEDAEAATIPARFNPDDMREESKIVEFLQVANRRPLLARRRRIALVISAWDVVSKGATPETWLAEHRPMIDQFLLNNADLWELRVYGVSAQGGRLPEDRKRLEKFKKPSERIRLVGHGAAPHDLTAPFSWLGAA